MSAQEMPCRRSYLRPRTPSTFAAGRALRRADAGACATVWRSLNSIEQDRLLHDLVESVEFRRKNTEMQVTFTDRFMEVLSDCQK